MLARGAVWRGYSVGRRPIGLLAVTPPGRFAESIAGCLAEVLALADRVARRQVTRPRSVFATSHVFPCIYP